MHCHATAFKDTYRNTYSLKELPHASCEVSAHMQSAGAAAKGGRAAVYAGFYREGSLYEMGRTAGRRSFTICENTRGSFHPGMACDPDQAVEYALELNNSAVLPLAEPSACPVTGSARAGSYYSSIQVEGPVQRLQKIGCHYPLWLCQF